MDEQTTPPPDDHVLVTRATLNILAEEVAQTLALIVQSMLGAVEDAVKVVVDTTDIDFEETPEPDQSQLMYATAGSVTDIALTAFKDAFLKRMAEAQPS